jgi:hypothetical protein
MMRKKEESQPERQYEIRCRVTKRGHVIVTAESIDEARHKFDMREWESDSLDYGGEVVDWQMTGEPREVV